MNEIHLHRLDLNLLVTFEALMEEGSVVAAADRLALTPSAVSHALARLRAQLGDPLMVKVGGRMRPSPYALELIEEMRPILRGLRRVLAPPEPFDPATSERVFRIVMPSFPTVVAAILRRVQDVAPGVVLEWINVNAQLYASVADGLIDLAQVGGDLRLPHGLEAREVKPYSWFSFVRAGHPALQDGGEQAWRTWPHLQVKIDTNTKSPVDARKDRPASMRRIGARVAEFSSAGRVLAETDMIVTLPTILMAGEMETYGLRPLPPAVPPAPFPVRFVWSSRLAHDPGNVWLRTLVMQTYSDVQADADARVAAVTPGGSARA